MAIGTVSAFTLYNDQFYGGWSETIEQNVQVFNGASRGTIVMRTKASKGNYTQQTFMKTIAGLVRRRDPTSISGANDLPLAMGEISTVKVSRGIGPVAQTIDSLRKLGEDDQTVSYVLGEQVGAAVMQEQVSTILSAGVAGFLNQSDVYYDGTASTISHTALTYGMQKFGDASSRIAAWVMHSKVYFDLIRQAMADELVEVAGVVIYSGNVATFNRPVIVTDDASLVNGATYYTLGVTENGLVIEESEEQNIVAQTITGLENLAVRLQGEYAYNIGMKGYTWDTGNGGTNPTAGAIATGSNWDRVSTDHRSTGGVVIATQ